MSDAKIVSFLPAATEMVGVLGLMDRLVGVSHECDYPPEAQRKTVVVRCAIDFKGMSMKEIDQTVTRLLQEGKSLYQIDEGALRNAAPGIIISQELCRVCASSGNDLTRLLGSLSSAPQIIWQKPQSFEDVFREVMVLGEKAGVPEKAVEWIRRARSRIDRVVRITSQFRTRIRVFFLEWTDPVYCGGHWIPRMIQQAGGEDPISRHETDSVRVPWEDVLRWNPEVLILAPCGFNAEQSLKQAELLKMLPGWKNLSAVRNRRVYAVDAGSYFARPGPRLVDGVELLAHLIHPQYFEWNGPAKAWARVE